VSSNAVIELDDLVVQYPGASSPALVVDSLHLKAGQPIALIGPNGAGKSTLLKTLVGLVPLVQGQVRVFGAPVGAARTRVAYVPQRRGVDWRFPITAAGVALMGRDVHLRWPRWPRAADRVLAADALAAVGMAAYANTHIGNLSGGQQQRVFLARAIAQQADLLLLDEPFTGVDLATQMVIFRLINQFCQSGKTVVVATHDLATVANHFGHVVLVQQQLHACGTPDEVMQPELLARAYGGPLALFYQEAVS
jgi:manganese/zinc/iron transport system ATP- binding protein